MRNQLLFAAIGLAPCAAVMQGGIVLTSEEMVEALANWNKTMEAHRVGDNIAEDGRCYSTNGQYDLRKNLPACLQYDPNWCWATAVAELAHFYKPDEYPETGSDCHGVECKVVSNKEGHDLTACCPEKVRCHDPAKPTCCKSFLGTTCQASCGPFGHKVEDSECTSHSCSVAGSPRDITDGIEFMTGEKYTFKPGPLWQRDIDQVVGSGYPVLIIVTWEGSGGGHVLSLAGCGNGKYFLHDPWTASKQGRYQVLTYKEVLQYHPPYAKGYTANWATTFYRQASLNLKADVVV